MFKLLYLLSFLFSLPSWASLPMDVVFDIDQTIATLIHEGRSQDWLADPLDPSRGVVEISYDDPKVDKLNRPLLDSPTTRKTSKYRIYDGVGELLQELKKKQSEGLVRISFFSGGKVARNKAILESILLPDGTTALDLVSPPDSLPRVYGGEHMVRTSAPEEAWFRLRFKKDLSVINPQLEDVILIDDIKEFVPDSQLKHVLWIDEVFPYPERIKGEVLIPAPEMIRAEKEKFQWIKEKLFSAIERRLSTGVPLSQSIQDVTRGTTPFSALPDALTTPFRCRPVPIIERLLLEGF